jgi:sugar phosphate isomerase/epimerase
MSLNISINTLCLEPATLATQAACIAKIGADAISPGVDEVESIGAVQAARLFRDTGLSVAVLTHRAFGFVTSFEARKQRDRLMATIDMAHTIGAVAVCLTSGSRGEMSWPEAARRFAEEIAPCAEYARNSGVALGIEPTSHLYADVSIAHRLSDTVSLARAANIGVGIDLFACWVDADIESAIAVAGPICAFVQVSDYVFGDRALPCRAVPGDGTMPLDHLIGLILATGYRGSFDLEIIGPRLAAEGCEAGLRRAISNLQRIILSRLAD